ncbi:4'-phosphopantetheinyl transferase superfamily protein [Candidatus Woesearchaeota archaeon]|nr:4'-phosphopantetheinyl transferase superfamily protein [Candidatus Woesearchaeota archaeon]
MSSGFAWGIGADVEDTKRFKGLDRKKNIAFLSKIFNGQELDYCFSKQKPYLHLAARFAGKESVLKALNSAGQSINASAINKIMIFNDKKGLPLVRIDLKDAKDFEVKLSLSHVDDKAFACALAFRRC